MIFLRENRESARALVSIICSDILWIFSANRLFFDREKPQLTLLGEIDVPNRCVMKEMSGNTNSLIKKKQLVKKPRKPSFIKHQEEKKVNSTYITNIPSEETNSEVFSSKKVKVVTHWSYITKLSSERARQIS